ncbi:sugar transferase [Georgenia soli]|uniref:sugar transferase n=1 Tax=Georgenia soli TaxID=638953 RepID=UPI001FE55685|nr:sugar transferase [Georgenia soli]
MIAIAIAIKLDTRGPALFRQIRIGRTGQPFRIHKFRTMIAGAPGSLVSTSDDQRITRIGRILRATKLDELPQFIDVVAGHMSIVGPRPEVPAYVDCWPPQHREIILSIRPGITDPASIQLRHESDLLANAPEPDRYYREVLLPLKTSLYVQYVETRSLRGDLAIMFKTAAAVLRR